MTSGCRRVVPVVLRARVWVLACAVACVVALAPGAVLAQQPAPSAASPQVAGQHAAEGRTSEGEHADGILRVIARLVNFAALAGILVYFLKAPLLAYLQSRGTEIRQDLVTAAEMRRAASAQLTEIDQKLKALPGELDALKARGAEDVRAEQGRIVEAIQGERARLLEHTRREIEMRLRVARRELIEHAAELAVQVAEARIRRAITPEDHLRLIDRYTTQVEEAR